jgi:hypothetical protein
MMKGAKTMMVAVAALNLATYCGTQRNEKINGRTRTKKNKKESKTRGCYSS